MYRMVGKFRGSKVFSIFKKFRVVFMGACSCLTNYMYIVVVRVKFYNFNPTTKLTKFKHPQNLATAHSIKFINMDGMIIIV